MEQVIGVIGHELRTPLTGLQVLSEYLITEGCNDQSRQFVHLIHDEVIRLSGMVNNMLEAARLNSGSARWNWASVDLAQLCHNAVRVVRPLVAGERVVLTCDANRPTPMLGDGEAIVRLLVNILSNAQKHTERGAICLDVSTVNEHGEKWAVVRIRDTGGGIKREIAGRLGVPFALNAGAIGSGGIKGTGLGLAICKGIAAAHGGSITLASTAGAGTAVTIRLRTDLMKPAACNTDGSLYFEVAA